MIITKDSNNDWTPIATGNGTFVGTNAAFNAIKDTLPVNTVAYITDDGNSDLQPIDSVTNGNMNPVTSNAVYDALPNKSTSTTITMTMTNNTEHVTGTPVNTTLIKLGSNWGIVIGKPSVPATTTGTISCAVSITGATIIDVLSINAWQSGIISATLAYNAAISDFYLQSCQGNNYLTARIVALVSW